MAVTPDLSPAELDVLHLVAEGLSNHEIADRLCISENTVKSHLQHLFQKIGVDNRTKLAVFAHAGKVME